MDLVQRRGGGGGGGLAWYVQTTPKIINFKEKKNLS